MREATVSQPAAGAFTATLSLKQVHTGRFTLHLLATDTDGATSAPVDVALRIRR